MSLYGAVTQTQPTTEAGIVYKLNTIQTHLDRLQHKLQHSNRKITPYMADINHRMDLIRGMVSEVLKEIEMNQQNVPMGTALSPEEEEAIHALEVEALRRDIEEAMRDAPGRGGIGIHRSRRRRRTTKRRR